MGIIQDIEALEDKAQRLEYENVELRRKLEKLEKGEYFKDTFHKEAGKIFLALLIRRYGDRHEKVFTALMSDAFESARKEFSRRGHAR